MRDIDLVEERARASAHELSIRLRSGFDDDTAAQLALLQLMPFEEDEVPLHLVETVLERNPRHGLANLERSYLSLHYVMDDADLRKSARNLETQIERNIQVAGSALQLGEVRRALDIKSTFSDTIDVIRVALAAEPGWTLSHLQQARSLRENGEVDEARAAYERAISNLIDNDLELAPLDWSFAACFTGQLMSREALEKERDEIA